MALKLVTPSKSRKFGRKREELRNLYWPGSESEIWSRKTHDGYTSIPRTLPLLMRLIRELSPKSGGNPAGVYMDLWSRVFDEGFIQVTDDDAFAYAAGYSGQRAVRTWRDHIQTLTDLGFIRTKQRGNKDVAAILIIDPYRVVVGLREAGRVPEEWWAAFVSQCQDIGAVIPDRSAAAKSG